MKSKKEVTVIDLFCGIGGLFHGFVNERFNVIAGYDNDPTYRFAFEGKNNPKFYLRDITELQGTEIKALFDKDLKTLVGCAPCQPFSSYSFKLKKKMNILYTFSRLVEEVMPIIVSMEKHSSSGKCKNNKVQTLLNY